MDEFPSHTKRDDDIDIEKFVELSKRSDSEGHFSKHYIPVPNLGTICEFGDDRLPFPEELAKEVCSQAKSEESRGSIDRTETATPSVRADCKKVAWRFCIPDYISGRRIADGAIKGFFKKHSDFEMHVINYKLITPRSYAVPEPFYLAFDATAGYNWDNGKGEYDVLAFKAKTLSQLLTMVTAFYDYSEPAVVLSSKELFQHL